MHHVWERESEKKENERERESESEGNINKNPFKLEILEQLWLVVKYSQELSYIIPNILLRMVWSQGKFKAI